MTSTCRQSRNRSVHGELACLSPRALKQRLSLVGLLALIGTACGQDRGVTAFEFASVRTAPEARTRTAGPLQPRNTEPMPPELRQAFLTARQKAAGPEFAYAAADTSEGSVLRAENPTQRFRTELTPQGARLRNSDGSVVIRLAAWGCPDAMSRVGSRVPRPADAGPSSTGALRVQYDGSTAKDHLVEWYQNGPAGLEQGFTVDAPPPCQQVRGGPLRFEVAIQGVSSLQLAPERAGESSRVELTVGVSSQKLIYSDLYAQDAEGKRLPVQLNVEGGLLALSVDARDARYPLDIDPLIWNEASKIISPDIIEGDEFGGAISISGDTAVIGPTHYSPEASLDVGRAYVFVRSGANWTLQATLTSDDGIPTDQFGCRVSISGDTILVGAFNASPGGIGGSGAAYVFVRSGTSWTQQAKLTPSDPVNMGFFGFAVSLFRDTAVVGAYGAAFGGSAYVFVRNGMGWTQQVELTPSSMISGEEFGVSVSLFEDTVLVGATQEGWGGVGAAYVFVRDTSTGTTWTQQAELVGTGLVADSGFGWAVSLYKDTAVVGAFWASPGAIAHAGAAYVFERSDSSWIQQAELTASDLASNGFFGAAVSLLGDRVVVGSAIPGEPATAGAAYLLERSGTMWTERAKLLSSDLAPEDHLGEAVALSEDTAMVGAWAVEISGIYYVGATYVFPLKKDISGTPCVLDSDCQSGYCVDGMCCDTACSGGTSDCQACSHAAGAAADGTCGPRNSGTVCASADDSKCVARGVCDGKAPTCQQVAAADTVVCNDNPDPETCRANYRCDGVTAGSCPRTNPTPAANAQTCNAVPSNETPPTIGDGSSMQCQCQLGERTPRPSTPWVLLIGIAALLWRRSRRIDRARYDDIGRQTSTSLV